MLFRSQVKGRIKADLGAIRYGFESAGVIWNDAVYSTDPQSKVNYLAASLQAQANPSYSVAWKAQSVDNTGPVFVTLTANDIVHITEAGINYIAQCFAREQELTTTIDTAQDVATIEAIDLRSGWPDRNVT